MPNDAKLGLLVGVAGVLIAAVMFSPKAMTGQSVTASVPRDSAKAPAKPAELPPAQAAMPAERPTTPSKPAAYAAKPKPELEGTAVVRKGKRGE